MTTLHTEANATALTVEQERLWLRNDFVDNLRSALDLIANGEMVDEATLIYGSTEMLDEPDTTCDACLGKSVSVWLLPSGRLLWKESEFVSRTHRRDRVAPWRAWVTVRKLSARWTKLGYPLIVQRRGRAFYSSRLFSDSETADGTGSQTVDPVVPELLRLLSGRHIPTSTDVFPFAAHNLDLLKSMHAGSLGSNSKFLAAFAWTADASEITFRLFRSRRKDLVKAVADPHLPLWALELAWVSRGQVPVDWLVNFLREAAQVPLGARRDRGDGWSFQRRLFLRLDQRTIRRLLLTTHSFESFVLSDIVWMLRKVNVNDIPNDVLAQCTDWREIHDTLVRQLRQQVHQPPQQRKAAARSGKFAIPRELKGLHQLEHAGLRFVVAASSDELVDWGAYMHNCIASYASRAAGKRLSLVAVFDGDKMVANAELSFAQLGTERTFSVVQLLGRFNRRLEHPLLATVIQGFESAGVSLSETALC